MKHNIYYDEEQGTVYMKLDGEFTQEHAIETISLLEKMYEDKERHYLLADVRKSPGIILDKKTRKVLQSAEEKIGLDKVAVVGADPATRMTAKIVLVVMGKGKANKFCKTEEEALAWLKGDAKR